MRRLVPVWKVRDRKELGEPEQLRQEFVEDRVRELLAEGAVSVAVQELVRLRDCSIWEGEFRSK